MANPVSKGIGTGAAQVFDVSRMDRSMNKAFDTINAKKEAEEKARIAKKKLDDAGKGKLKGQFEDLDYSNVMLGDQKVLASEVTEEMSRFDGHWGEILNGDPEWANKYRQSMAGLKAKINTSAISKPLADAQYDKMKEPDSGYSPEAIKNYEKLKAQPGYNHDEMLQSGALNRDQIIGSIFENTDKAFLENTDSLYDYRDAGSTDGEGNYYKVDSKTWKSDEEAFPKFKETVEANPSLMQDMNIQYAELPLEDRMKALYDGYKESRRLDEKATIDNKAKKDEDGNGEFSFNNETYSVDVRKVGGISEAEKVKIREKMGKKPYAMSMDEWNKKAQALIAKASGVKGGGDVLTIAKKKGGGLTPFKVGGTLYGLENITREGGKIYVNYGAVKTQVINGREEVVLTGEPEKRELTPKLSSAISAAYGIKDVNSFIEKNLGGGQTETTEDNPLGLDL